MGTLPIATGVEISRIGFLVLLINDSEYSQSKGAKPIPSPSCIYLVSPAALLTHPTWRQGPWVLVDLRVLLELPFPPKKKKGNEKKEKKRKKENQIDSSKSFKSLKNRFESSSVALINMTTFGVAVGATVLSVKVEIEDRYQLHKYLH
jgi:hypothetical protein